MEKKTTPKKSSAKKSQVKTSAKKPAQKTQVVKTTKKAPSKNTQVVKTTKKSQTKTSQVKRRAVLQKQNANTGYLLGLVSLIAWIIPVVGAIVTVSGIYCCYSGMKSKKALAMTGLFLNMLFLGLSIVNVNVDLALMM